MTNEFQPERPSNTHRGLGPDREAIEDTIIGIEVAATSFTYDSTLKRRLYERAGVQEYLLLQLFERGVEWWSLESGKYQPIVSDEKWVYESKQFPGLRLDSDALWAGDMAAVLAAL